METRKFRLVKCENDNDYLIFTPDEIVNKVDFFESYAFLLPCDVDKELIKKLIKLYQEQGSKKNFDELLNEYNISYDRANYSEYADSDVLVVFPDEKNLDDAIVHMSDLWDSEVIEYFDGNTIREIWLDKDNVYYIDVIVDDDSKVSLDAWNGNNWCYLSPFNHACIYKVVSVDDADPEDNEQYLFYEWTQFQGNIPRGRFLSDIKAKELIEAN